MMLSRVVVFSFLVSVVLSGLSTRHSLGIGSTSDGRALLLAVDSNRFVTLSIQIERDEDRFSPFENLGGIATSTAAAGALSDHGLVVLVRDADNEISLKHAMSDKTWSVWKKLSSATSLKALMEPMVFFNPQTHLLEIYVVGVDEHLYRTYEVATGDSTAFAPLEIVSHVQINGLPQFVVDNENKLRMYIRGGDNFVYESIFANNAWGKLRTDSGLRVLGDPQPIRNNDGRLEIFARGADNKIYHKFQTVVRSSEDFSEWASLAGLSTGNPAAVLTWDKRPEIFIRGSDNAIWTKEFGFDEGWGHWTSLGGKFVDSPKVFDFDDGRILLFAVARDATIWFRSQSGVPNPVWNSWKSLGGDVFG
eukprot:comp15294_c0_seq1/m.23086 comp15294_c0_seq1/g.23086  ORF comp15294_c0_seq1/g.23086 comp15294_c0_seq1/m.23086 type:complete len:363 (-) comp15294_c0_seq1:116-1204(-)